MLLFTCAFLMFLGGDAQSQLIKGRKTTMHTFCFAGVPIKRALR
jgi:hypothetical protein